MLALTGCVQESIAPNINAAASRVLDRIGISLLRAPEAGCCGAVDFHLDAQERARERMRALIDAWWPALEDGVEAIVFTASGCGAMLKEYAHLLGDDPAYAERAQRVSAACHDIGEVLHAERTALRAAFGAAAHARQPATRVAFHSPCTLQHALALRGQAEAVLADLGVELTTVPDAHLCCGSAGTYSILQPEISGQLARNKLAALESGAPQCILTANIGCLVQLAAAGRLPVRHWIELVDELIGTAPPGADALA